MIEQDGNQLRRHAERHLDNITSSGRSVAESDAAVMKDEEMGHVLGDITVNNYGPDNASANVGEVISAVAQQPQGTASSSSLTPEPSGKTRFPWGFLLAGALGAGGVGLPLAAYTYLSKEDGPDIDFVDTDTDTDSLLLQFDADGNPLPIRKELP